MDPIQIVYLAFYLGFNLFFGVFFFFGTKMLIKGIRFKKRKKYFVVPGKAQYVKREKLRDRITGWEYRYTYRIKVEGTILESTIDSISNEKAKMEYPMDKKWTPVMVNPENHSEFRLPSEDNAIRYYTNAAKAFLIYGIACRILFELVIWGPFLEEGGLR